MAAAVDLSETFTAYEIPLSALLKWPPANFLNPPTRHWFVLYASILQVLSTLVIAARLWTRFGKRAGGLGPDDILITFAWLYASAMYALGVYSVLEAGLDRSVWNVRPTLAAKAALIGWITELLFVSSLCLTKVSMFLFFRRLIDRSYSRVLSYSITGAIVFTIMHWIAFFFFLVFACTPISAAWKSLDITWTGHYTCASRKIADPLNGILSVLTDVYAIGVPVIFVSKMTIPWDRKMMLYGIFCCGVIALGAGIAKTIYLARMYTDPLRDLTDIGYELLVWGTLEVQLALVCASAPAMKGFFIKFGEVVAVRYGTLEGKLDNRYYIFRAYFPQQRYAGA